MIIETSPAYNDSGYRIMAMIKGGFKSEDTGEFLHLKDEYSKSQSWAENLNFPPIQIFWSG